MSSKAEMDSAKTVKGRGKNRRGDSQLSLRGSGKRSGNGLG